MGTPRLVALPCSLAPGMFSSERVFAVVMANGDVHRGLAPRGFCWNADGKPLGENEPTQETPGLVAGRAIEQLDDAQVAVAVPDGDVIAVDSKSVRPRPTEIRPPGIAPL